MPVPRRSGDDVPCSPERDCCAALRRRIPADCVLAGTDRIRCRTGRTSRRRLSYVHIRKERASFARAHPHKGFGARDDGRNGCGIPEVANLKHAARGMRRPRGGLALRDKAEQSTWNFYRPAPFRSVRFAAEIRPVADAKCFMRFTCGRRHRRRRSCAGRPRRHDAARARHRDARACARMERRRGRAVHAARHVRAASALDVSPNADTEPGHALDAPLSRRADAPRRRTARRRARRCCRDRSARARSSSGRASRARCRVRRQPC